ncbi:MAG: adenylate/guanylate cyclase domain-containing protein [Pseudomonadota bacterium]
MDRVIRVTLIVTAISSVVGALIGLIQSDDAPGWSILAGALTGSSIAFGCTVVEMGVLSNSALRLVRRLPPLVIVGLRGILYSFVILGGMSLQFLVLSAPPPWAHDGFNAQFLMSCAVAAIFSIGIEVVRFLGTEASLSLISTRYTEPRLEERVVLFADVVGSTALGEALGALGFHRFLSEVALDLAGPINAAGGTVHRYVGDAVIVTWPAAHGLRDGACLACAQQMHAVLARAAPRYEKRFGAAPKVRVAVHVGVLAVGEMGDWKKEIALLGDLMNTAARIEAAAKQFDAPTVLSDALVQQLEPEARAELTQLPQTVLDGKADALVLWRDG